MRRVEERASITVKINVLDFTLTPLKVSGQIIPVVLKGGIAENCGTKHILKGIILSPRLSVCREQKRVESRALRDTAAGQLQQQQSSAELQEPLCWSGSSCSWM